MKNITLKIDDETYRKARLRAAAQGTSVSALVRIMLESMENDQAAEELAEQTRVKRLLNLYAEADAKAQKEPPEQPWTFTREECYEERVH
jgi:plasmid stability protein